MNNPISACLKNTPALKSYWSINLKSLKFPVIAVFVLLASLLHVKANRFYVDGSKPDNSGAGTSWATAKRDIQNAVNTALPGDSVWVKAGTYYPTEWPGSSNTAEPRNKTFYLKSGVKLFGGFAGTETFFAQRNVIDNSTVLSGNIGSPSLQSDNCFHVVVISNQTATTTGPQIDGFSIRDGYADNSNTSYILNGKLVENVYGAGIYCINGTNNIIGNNIITNNRANIYGAAIYITADTTLSDFYMYGNNIGNNYAGWNGGGVYASKAFCNLYNNNFHNDTAAISGGGIYYAVGKCTIEYNTVDGNKANQNGGGIMIVESFAKMANNTIRNNSTNFNGGGIYLFNTNGGSVCINNLLDKNAALQEGGGIYLSPAASCAFAGNTITGNTSNANGGGFFNASAGAITIENNIFWNNKRVSTAATPGADFSTSSQITSFYNNLLQLPATSYAVTNFNMLALGSSNNIFATSPLFVDSTDADGPDNINRTADDGFALQATSPCINSGRVMANSSAIRPYDIRYETRIFPDMGAYEIPAPCPLGSVLYVDSSVSISGNGQSWIAPFKELSDALAIAWNCTGVNTILVAKGTYKPQRKAYEMQASRIGWESSSSEPRDKLFHLRTGLEVIGGYAPGGSSRNPVLFPTVLDGNLGTGIASYHGLLMDTSSYWGMANDTTILDGFTIRNANASSGILGATTINGSVITRDKGAGLLIPSGTHLIRNCRFQNNFSSNQGGAAYLAGAARTVFNTCNFISNNATNDGGALYISGNNHTVTASVLTANTAALGGAVSCSGGTARFLQNVFATNSAALGAAGYFSNIALTAQNNLFSANSSSIHGGAVYLDNGNFQMDNNTYYNNAASGYGGAIYTANTPIVSLRNSVFWANKMNGSSTVAGADFFNANTLGNNASYKNNALQLTSSSYALVTHNELSAGSTNNIFAVSPKFTDSTDTDGADNLFRTQDDGLQLKSNSPCINAGITGTDIPATDMLDIARYSPDMGAYEYSICPATNVLYVDSSITISGNGSTWATAFKNLDTALYLAWQCPDVTAVYVAKGTYKPVYYPFNMNADRTGTEIIASDTRYRTFHIRTGLELYGGYPNGGGTRNITTNITRLSGDIDAAGTNDACHVVMTDSSANWAMLNDTTVLDGFTVSGGAGLSNSSISINGFDMYDDDGAGIYAFGGTNRIKNNTVTNNNAPYTGGGMSISGGRNNISNNNFFSNTSGVSGGGMYFSDAVCTVTENNIYSNSSDKGGGIAASGGKNNLNKNQIFSNSSVTSGGAVRITSGVNIISNNTIKLNAAPEGGAIRLTITNTRLENNFIDSNTSTNGGAVYSLNDTISAGNNVVWANTATQQGGGFYISGPGSYKYTNNSIFANTATVNGGAFSAPTAASAILFRNNILWANKRSSAANTGGSDIYGAASWICNYNLMQLPDNKYSAANTNVLAGGSTNNLFAVSPKFADTTDVNGPDNIDMTVDDGLRLLNTSPCVNAGSNGFVPATITTDIAGSSRIQTVIVDMGAYEAPCIPTFSSFAVTACTSYFFNGNTLGSSGAYKDTLVNAVGCDSIITLNLTVIGTSTLYVDSSIASSGNGISWATAIKNLDSALYLAWQCPNITVINVAKGTYKPTHLPFEMNAGRTGTEIAETDSRLKTFHLRTGLKIFGGYPSGGGLRNTLTNLTGLSGDIDNAGAADVYHVVLMDSSSYWAGTSDSTVLDGLYISNGMANDPSVIVLNGKGLWNNDAAGINMLRGTNVVRNCSIFNNVSVEYGGGIGIVDGNNFISSNKIYNNTAAATGGGVDIALAFAVVRNNEIYNNKAGQGGGISCYQSLNILDSNIVYADTATQDGAGIYMEQSDNVIINNIIRDNSAVAYGGAIATDASTSVCNNNFILNNTAASGGGISAFQDGLFSAANNVIANNNSISGGGIFFDGAGNFRFDNNTIAVNSASGSGGGMYVTAAGNTIAFTNNIFWNNKKAGAANISGADFESSDINVFKNNLLQLPQAFYAAGNSNLLNVASVNNLFAVNPQFKDSSNLKGADNIYGTNDDGFVVKSFSPLINAGNNSAVTGIIIDAAHAARIVYGTVDIGAYEFGLINCSGINTWLGAVSSDWNNAANWTCNVPGINDEVIIRSGVLNMPVVNTDVTIKKLTALAGSTVTILTGKKLTLTGQ